MTFLVDFEGLKKSRTAGIWIGLGAAIDHTNILRSGEFSINSLQKAFGKDVSMALVVQGHVVSVLDRLEGGRLARDAGLCDRVTPFHADFQTDHLRLSCPHGGSRGDYLWLWLRAATECESDKCQRGIAF
jgi:hypothetical protein